MNRTEQEQAAWERYKATAKQRKEFTRAREAGHTVVADTREQLAARARRLVRRGEVDPDALARAMEQPSDGRALERIIESADLQKVNFLGRGADAARAVARVMIRQGRTTAGFGSGFLVGRRLVLTNNHVLPDVATASGSLLEFDFEDGPDGLARPVVRWELDPAALFLTDEGLDYTLVAVRPDATGRAAGDVHGWNVLLAQQGKIVIGEPVNVVGHPDGRPKEIAIRENQLVNQLPDFLHYVTDTEPGNSGSPVFNDQWEVVALHHSGVRDPAGGPDDWIANEGARISRVMENLRAKAVTPAQQAVLAELGAAAEALPVVRIPEAVITAAAAVVRQPSGAVGRPSPSGRRLVYLHGRGQGGRDPNVLRADWTGGLVRGLAAAGLPPVDAAEAWLPFYGDVLATAQEFAPAGDTTAERTAPPPGPARDLYGSLLQEAAAEAGYRAEPTEGSLLGGVVAALQRPLSWLAARSGLDDVVIAAVFRDVALYLGDDTVRKSVLDVVRAGLPADGEIVLVAHSLGTVVAMDLLDELPGTAVPLLVTAGSPLGMDAVQDKLLTDGPTRPAGVATWVNAWAAADAVAIGCPLADDWRDVRDLLTDNPKDRPHDIREYLSDPRVAGEIGRLLR